MKPLFFSSGGDPVYGGYHPAKTGQSTVGEFTGSMAVVICPAFGQEGIRSHKSLLSLANRLAKKGVHVLRFAYRGTDDSALWSDEILSLQDWRQDIIAAKAELKRRSGCTSVMLVGLRLGANLAVDVARKSEDVHSLLLWEPIENGSDYVENLRCNQRTMIDLWHGQVSTDDTEEVEELFSTRYQRCLLSEIEQVCLNTELLEQPTLVISAANRSNPLPGHLGLFHDDMEKRTESVEPDGWKQLDQLEVVWWRPQALNQVVAGVQEIFTRVESYGWHRQQSVATVKPLSSPSRELDDVSRAGDQPLLDLQPDQRSEYRESAIQFGDQIKLTGILTEPETRHVGAPVVILINAGIVHRVGPFRLHVNVARLLAKHGFASLRMDLSGLGDSQGRTGKLNKDERVRRDIAEAMEFLAAAGLGNSFVVLGLCSGAYHAHKIAVADPRVVGAIFLDGIVFRTMGYFWRHRVGRLFRARFWRNALKRRWLSLRRKQGADFYEQGNKLAEAEYFQVTRSRQAIADELHALQARDTQLLFIYTGDYDDICDRHQFQEMFGIKPNDQVQVDYLAEASHTYRIAQHRDELLQRIAGWMKDRFL